MKRLISTILLLTIIIATSCIDPQGKHISSILQSEVTYATDSTNLKGYIAVDEIFEGKRPGILIVHEWWGHNDYVRERANMLAKLGYTALAVDMYGDGKTAAARSCRLRTSVSCREAGCGRSA